MFTAATVVLHEKRGASFGGTGPECECLRVEVVA